MTDNLLDPQSTHRTLTEAFVELLVKAEAPRRSAELYVELRGLGGSAPKSLRRVSRELSSERVRQLVSRLEATALRRLHADFGADAEELRLALATSLRRIERHAPGCDEDIRRALAAEFEPLETSPACVVRLADVLGVHHSLRLTTWSARAKFADEERLRLACPEDGDRMDHVCGIVADTMPEVFVNFINFVRKFSRGAGVVAAGQMAARYGSERGVAIAPHEAVAFLRPFAVHLGRHDGDEWFAFFNSANEFIRKVSARVDALGSCSFEAIRQFHERFNRSLYTSADSAIPESALKAALELAGYELEGDLVRRMGPMLNSPGRGISEVQARMVAVFRDTLAKMNTRSGVVRKAVRRADLVKAMESAGIRESTARVYLGSKGLFTCVGGSYRLADSSSSQPVPNREKAGAAVRGWSIEDAGLLPAN